VNVRKNSDVDIGVLCFDSYFPEYPDDNVKVLIDKTARTATYTYAAFKNEIEDALVNRFGRANVQRGKKSFDVHENTYRVEADVAAFFEHRRYTSVSSYLSGVEMITDDLPHRSIKNWPEQHYENGVAKNDLTNRRYKRVVRILKTLCIEMAENGIAEAKSVPGFLIECLVWNVPNDNLRSGTYRTLIRSALAHLFNNTRENSQCSEWGEVSELKYLFRRSQPWSRQQAHSFIDAAWDYIGYE
jgi:hypothetical protein